MRILIQGAGSIGQRHYKNVRALGHEPAFLRSNFTRRPFVNDFFTEQEESGASVLEFESIDVACTSWRPDALIIATPNHLHLEAAIAGAQHGLHLLIEKPLHNDTSGLEELAQVVAEKNLTLLVGYNLRFHPLLQEVKRIVERGEIGAILSASVEVGESIEDWHPWEDYRDTYAPYVKSGGGSLLCFSHDIDYLYWLLGAPDTVLAAGGKVTPLAGDAEDLVQSLWSYKDGRSAMIHVDYYQRPKVRTLKLIGTTGTLVWDAYGSLIQTEHKTGAATTHKTPDGFERNDMFLSELRHFVNCITGKDKPIVPLQEGREVLQIIERMKESLV